MTEREDRRTEIPEDGNRARLRAAARKKKRRGTVLGVLAATLVLFTLIVYGCFKVVDKVFDRPASEVTSSRVIITDEGTEIVDAASDNVVYSQLEMEQLLAQAKEEAKAEESDRILSELKESFSDGMTTVEALRPHYPNDIVVASSGKIHFVPINYNLKQNEYIQENLSILETGEYQYYDGEQVISHKGIDVSSHQGEIDWEAVAADGVEFAFIRVGFRGYGSEGKLVEDELFEANITGAQAAGIKVGVYFFSQAVNEEELMEEANLVLSKLEPYELQLPVAYDVEKVSSSGARMNKISVEERTRLSLLFCETMQKAGYQPMLYHNTEMAAVLIDISAFEGYAKWYASYNKNMFYPYDYQIWQYSEKGRINGIKGNVDMNICIGPLGE